MFEILRFVQSRDIAESQLAEVVQERDALKQHLDELSHDNAQLREQQQSLQQACGRAKEQCDKLTAQLDSAAATRESTAERVRDLSSQCATLTIEKQQLNDRVRIML